MRVYQETATPYIAFPEIRKVEEQVGKIIASLQFKSANQMKCFLTFVVQQTLNGQSNRIKQYTIAVEALNLTTDFDSDFNPYVRVLGGRVRGRLLDYYQGEGVNDPIRISLPKGSYKPLIEAKDVNTEMVRKLTGVSTRSKDLAYYVLMS